MLLLTESCDFGLSRWSINGNVSVNDGYGINQSKGIMIEHAGNILQNKITRQFRAIDNLDEKRDFRLSFWIKIDGKITENSEFISVKSLRHDCGAMIGIDTNGRLYATNLYAADIPGYNYTKDNPAHPNLMNSQYHYVEIYAKYDADWTGCVRIYVNNMLYINQEGINLLEDFCWSRPDTITFGNLIDANLYLDDIILWDDLGNECIGYRGSSILSSQTIVTNDELYGIKTKLFDVDNSGSLGSMITMSVTATEAKEAVVKPVQICDGQKTEGKEKAIFTVNETHLSMAVSGNKTDVKVGIERVS